jgi:8-oxo-dGTP pyrophosphatase MutT (NUDIX family)
VVPIRSYHAYPTALIIITQKRKPWYHNGMRTIKRDIVGAFIFSADNKLLLGKAGVYADKWVIPGGGIEQGETRLEALNREILEETGLDITNAKLTPLQDTLTGQSEKVLRDTGEKVLVDMQFFNYKVELSMNADQIILATEDDFTKAFWAPANDLKDLSLTQPSVVTLKKLGYL